MDVSGKETNMMNFDAQLMIDQINEEIVDKVKDVVQQVFSDVVDFSPTPMNNVGGFSEGSYVLSHRVALDNADNSITEVENFTPGAEDEARAYGAAKIESMITKPDVTVVISNSVGHALDVEIGENWVKTPGYHTYEKATQAAMERNS